MKTVYNKYFSLFGLLFAVGLTFYYLRFAITPFAISLIIAYLSMPLMTFGEGKISIEL